MNTLPLDIMNFIMFLKNYNSYEDMYILSKNHFYWVEIRNIKYDLCSVILYSSILKYIGLTILIDSKTVIVKENGLKWYDFGLFDSNQYSKYKNTHEEINNILIPRILQYESCLTMDFIKYNLPVVIDNVDSNIYYKILYDISKLATRYHKPLKSTIKHFFDINDRNISVIADDSKTTLIISIDSIIRNKNLVDLIETIVDINTVDNIDNNIDYDYVLI